MSMYSVEGAKGLDSQGSDYRLPPPGPDLKGMEKALKMAVKSSFHSLVKEDDADGLEEALEQERAANPKPPTKKSNKKKSGSNGTKEEDEFSILGRKILHYASALDAVDCCKLLLTSQNLPRICVDALDETDQRSALHIASVHHSKRCIEVLLKQGANVNLKNKQSAVPLEEALLSIKMHVDWDFSTPAAQIVEKVREKDLAALRSLEPKCKDLLIPVAFKLAKTLKLVPLVALLIVSRSSFVVNSVAKKVEGEEDSVGTLVDLLLGKALTCSSVCTLDRFGARPRKVYPDALVEGWPDLTRLQRTSYDGDGSVLDPTLRRNSSRDWETSFEPKFKRELSEWEDSSSEIKYRKDMSEWEEINSKYRSNGCEGESSNSDGKFRRSCSGGDMDKRGARIAEDKCSAAAREDVETNCKVARKLLECVLLFSPRLSAHPQSPSLPPLLRAAQANDEVLLSLLLEAGAPINETDSDGNTALHWVLRQATPVNKRSVNRKLVKRLLDAGANVLLGNKLGATPVHTSAGHGHFEALQLILEKEAGGVNVMAATKETPLHYSVKNNHILCTALLLTHGANRNVSSLRSQKPFQLAPSPEMRALLSLDEGTLRELPSDTLVETLVVYAQQQGMFQCVEPPSGSLPPTFAQATAQSIPAHHVKSQFQYPQAPGFSGTQPLSFSQSLSMPALSESFTTSQAVCKSSSASFQPPLSLRSQSLPVSHESSAAAWNSPWLALQKAASQKQPSNGFDLSQICEGESSSSKSSVNLPAYKTVLCRFYGTSDGCGWGTKCHFAHSEEELRVGQQNLKTLAEKSEGGVCSKTFQLMVDPNDQGVKNFKTKLCMHHEKLGTCPHGGKCKFAHGEGELRPLSASSSLTACTRVGMRPSTASSLASNDSEEGGDASSRKVFVGGLPHFINSDELWEFFESEFGKVVDAVVICGNDEEGNARSRGFGFVLFEQQKDADEAVKRHYFPFRGKKVEVKRAMARVDSPSEGETMKMASSFSSGISSPAAPESPAMPPSLPGVSLFNDGMQLPASPALGTTPAWSMLPMSGDNPQEGMQSSYMPPHSRAHHGPPTSMPYLSEQQKYTHVNAGPIHPQNSSKLYLQENAHFFQNNEPYLSVNAPTGQNSMQQPGGRNSRPQVEHSSVPPPKPYGEPSAYNGYNPSSSNPPKAPSLPSVSNGTGTQNSNPTPPFSYYDSTSSQSYFNSAQSLTQPPPPPTRPIPVAQSVPLTQPPPPIRPTPIMQSAPPLIHPVPPTRPSPLQGAESNQGEEDDELSQLIDLLNGSAPPPAPPPSSSATSQAYPQAYQSQPPASGFSSQVPPANRGMHPVLPAQNGAQETRPMYSRDPPPHLAPYNGRSSSLQPNYYGLSSPQLPDGFREVPQTPPANYKEMSQSSNSSAHPLSHPGAPLGYTPHLPVGSKFPTEGQASNTADVTAPRGAVVSDGAPSSTVINALLPGYGNSHSQGSHMYSSAPYGGFEMTR